MKKNTSIIFFLISVFILSGLIFKPVLADDAGLLPPAVQQFFDNSGNPLSSGKVYFYEVGTTTFKNTYTSSAATTINTNPITLNAGGKASTGGIYGIGLYRQQVKDRNNNIVWDAITAPGGGGATPTDVGDGNLVGTIIPWSGLVAPNQYVFTYGQELSRNNYPEFYTAVTQQLNVICTSASNTLTGISDTTQINIGSPVELALCVAAGTTVVSKTSSTVTVSNPSSVSINAAARFFPFGNGDGSTTFNVPDLRGRAVAGRDNMGGSAASRLTSTYFNTPGLGATGGSQSHTQTISEMALHDHGVTSTTVTTATPSLTNQSQTLVAGGSGVARTDGSGTAITISSNTTTIISPSGSSVAFSIVQPTIALNYIVKVTPDTSLSIATGVYSIGGMSGVISCSTGLLCSGNNISVIQPAGTISTGSADELAYYPFNGTTIVGTQNATISTGILSLGRSGAVQGQVSIKGSISGAVNIKTNAIAGIWDLTLPTTAGISGYTLSTDGSGGTSWVPFAGVINSGLSNQTPYYASNGTSLTATSAITISGSSAVLNDPYVNDNISFTSGGDDRINQSVGASQNVLNITGVGNNKTTSIHLNPGSGTLTTDTVAEYVLQRTADQAFGSNYGRYSFTTLGISLSNIDGMYIEYGGTVTPGPYIFNLGVENPASVFSSYEFMRFVTTGSSETSTVGAINFGASTISPFNQVILNMANIGSAGTRDSNSILLEGKANDGTERGVWWRQKVNVTSNAGASQYCNQSNLNGAGWITQSCLISTGILSANIFNATTGYRINGGASSGNVLRGNGTNFVSSTLAASDLSNGTTGSGSIVLATSPTFITSLTVPIVYGGSATGSNLTLTSTSNGSPSGLDYIRILVGGVENTRYLSGNTLSGITSPLGMGASGAITPNHLVVGNGTAASYGLIRQSSPGLGGALVVGGSSRSTPNTGSYSALQSGDGLLSLVGVGDTGSNLNAQGAGVVMAADGNWSTTSSPGRVSISTTTISATNYTERLRIDNVGHITTYGTAPILSSCGASPVISGNDLNGEVTMGTGAPSGCIITFANVYSTSPKCTVTWQTMISPMTYTLSTGNITLTQAATSSNKINYACKATG